MKKILLMFVLLLACGAVESSKVAEVTTTATEAVAPIEKYVIGDVIQAGDYEFVVLSVEDLTPSEIIKPKEDYRFLNVELAIKNIAENPTHLMATNQIWIKDNDDFKYTYDLRAATLSRINQVENRLDGELGSGESIRGFIAFQVPEDGDLTLVFKPNLFLSGKVVVVLTQ